ncbi:MAG: PAS domain-containing sensor histidine kinase [Chitinophagaceae bacterium]|nr:PAS domain-containing sensor histidine kinase [Chitinophagaceae bacterium]
MNVEQPYEKFQDEIEELHRQLAEANDTILAIRSGQVDALIVENGHGHQLYTLKTADQTYRVFIEKMKEGAVTLNEDGMILYSNSQFASMVNMPLAKVVGLRFAEFVPEEYKETFKDLMSRGWESDSKGEISLMNERNELIPFLLSFTSLELDEGPALSVILTNLSTQKENERQLQIKNEMLEEARKKAARMNEELEDIVKSRTKDLLVSREHFKFLADNIPVIVWTAQADGNADYFNKLWLEYTGLSLEDSRGSGSQKALHPDDFDRVVQVWNQALVTKLSFQFEYRIRRASDGEYRWHLGKGEPVKDDQGNIVAWFGTSTDIENQKQEIDRKDEFISVASHELKTPLTSLKGYMQLIQMQPDLSDTVNLYISKANASLTKIQHLINDLLDVSKIKAGKLKFSTSAFDLGELVNVCCENGKYMYPSYTIKTEISDTIMVVGNEERIEQVLMNLINNAVKYSPQNKEIIIRAEKDTNFAIISVIDSGIGMSRADQKKIFERFYRVEDKKFLTPGLGMGLYISSEIIKEHQGELIVKSQLHEGSVFSFTLPLAN